MRVILIPLAALFMMSPATAHAQYKTIELKILGMDCAICAHGVKVAVQKVDGVESVQLSLERAEADIRLKPENRVSLDQFRRIVKGNGFEPREAKVSVVRIGAQCRRETDIRSARDFCAPRHSELMAAHRLFTSSSRALPLEVHPSRSRGRSHGCPMAGTRSRL